MSTVWENASYSGSSLIVLLALADWANDEGIAWPSVDTLAAKARVDRRTAQRIVRQLVKDGVLLIEEGGGRGKRHHYRIRMAKRHPLQDSGISSSTVAVNLETAASDPENSGATPPDPLVDPLEEPSEEPSGPERVFGFYRNHMGHPRSVLTDERIKLINRRLKSYSEQDLCRAIEGCKLSAFHQGANDRNTAYDSIELILKDAEHIESFMARAESGVNSNNNGQPVTASDRRFAQIRENAEFLRSGGRPTNR